LALPRFAKGDLHAIRKTLLYKMSILGIFVLATITLYIVIAPFLYKLIFPNYLQSIYYSQIYSLSLIVGLAYLPTSILQSKIDALKELRYFGVSSSIFQIISVIFGAYLGGVIGIIFARIITRLFNLIVSTILTFKIKIKES
jgi:O-antigen/teichoic acid export membrane protein